MNLTLIGLRFKLLIRQKIGWVSLLAGLVLILIGFSTANVSFVAPGKIFWDFALGFSFLMVHVMGIYLAGQLFHDEKDRRTLHLILVGGVSRTRWLVANVCGIWLGLLAIDAVWFGTTWVISMTSFSWAGEPILLQVKLLQALSLLVVLSFTSLFSLFLRPLLTLFLASTLTFFLYSVSSIERIFLDKQSAHLLDSNWALTVLKVAKFFPPLEWFDVKMFVGFDPRVAWGPLLATLALGMAWSTILLGLASWRFQKLDL